MPRSAGPLGDPRELIIAHVPADLRESRVALAFRLVRKTPREAREVRIKSGTCSSTLLSTGTSSFVHTMAFRSIAVLTVTAEDN